MLFPAGKLSRFCFSVCANLIFVLGCACTMAAPRPTWFTRVWNTDDGLLNDQVDAIIQSSDGYLWVVPPVGLMRFDGERFSRFPIENYTSPTDNHIGTVLRSRTGILWIAMFRGTVIGLKPDFSTVPIPQAALPKETSFGLAEDNEGSLWLGYASEICRLKNGYVTQYGVGEGVPSGQVHSLISDGAGNVWLAKGNEICLFREGRFRRIVTMRDIRKLAATYSNAVWFITGTRLFHCDTEGILQDDGAFAEPGSTSGSALLEDRKGAVWIGTDGKGLIRFSGSRFEKVPTSYPSILGLAEDNEMNLWVGTDGGGMDRISLSAVRLETMECEGAPEQVQSICEDTNGRIWGVAYSGSPYHGLLVSSVTGSWAPAFTNSPFSGTVTCVASDGSGAVWVGTQDGALLRLAGTNGPVLIQNTTLGSISGILPTSNGDLWIVGSRELQYLHGGQLREVKLPGPVQKLSATTMDAFGNLWIGARNFVLRYDGTNFVDESPGLPIKGRWVNCLYETPVGSMWISGGGLGLLRLKDGRVDQIGTDQGLFDDYISQIVADRSGWLWFAGDHGVFKIRQRELERAMADHSLRLRPVVYGRNEGLSSLAALVRTGIPFAFPRALCSRDGRVWLLTHTGIVVADPNLLPGIFVPPPVLLTRVAMDGQAIASCGDEAPSPNVANLKTLNAALRLPPVFRHLEFDYTAFHFSAPESLRFRYRLAGFDTDWIDASAERHADYSRLTAGNYQFKVEACVGDGPWSAEPTTLAFTVSPFFWQTWWFGLGVLIAFSLSGVAIMRYVFFRRLQAKMRMIEERAALDRERARIARDLHDDLGCSLNKVALTMESMLRTNAPSEPGKIENCWAMVREVAGSVDEIVWAINPRNDTLPYMVDYLCQFAFEFLQVAEIPCLLELPENIPNREVSPELRHNLLLAVKEALNNVVRHAHATEVSLCITVSESQIIIVLKDNGQGFEHPPQNAACDGLRNMRQRMEEIGGQFQLTSEPGTGTRVAFLCPGLQTQGSDHPNVP